MTNGSKIVGIAAALAGMGMSATSADAQVVVMTNERTGGCLASYNRQNPYKAIAADARSRWGVEGKKVLASSRAGYGALFGAKNTNSGYTQFFLAHGYGSSEEAITAAKRAAADHIRRQGIYSTSFICANWNNRNEYPLDTYPVEG